MSALLPPRHEIKKLLEFVTKNEASDLHLKVGYVPYVRIAGHLRRVHSPPLPDSTYIEEMMAELIPPSRQEEFARLGGLDFSARSESGDRFRVNLFRSGNEMNAALRRVQSRIPNFDDLHPKLPGAIN